MRVVFPAPVLPAMVTLVPCLIIKEIFFFQINGDGKIEAVISVIYQGYPFEERKG